jgi:hypothetical protein
MVGEFSTLKVAKDFALHQRAEGTVVSMAFVPFDLDRKLKELGDAVKERKMLEQEYQEAIDKAIKKTNEETKGINAYKV